MRIIYYLHMCNDAQSGSCVKEDAKGKEGENESSWIEFSRRCTTRSAARLKINGERGEEEALNSSLALSTERIDGLNAVTILSSRGSSRFPPPLHLPPSPPVRPDRTF